MQFIPTIAHALTQYSLSYILSYILAMSSLKYVDILQIHKNGHRLDYVLLVIQWGNPNGYLHTRLYCIYCQTVSYLIHTLHMIAFQQHYVFLWLLTILLSFHVMPVHDYKNGHWKDHAVEPAQSLQLHYGNEYVLIQA